MANLDQLGQFYLGRRHDLSAGRTLDQPLLYDSKHLTTHAVCVGMTGSGKTGLCLSLLEEAALDGVPAIAVDPKGDLGNLLLTFPELRAADFQPWVDPQAAAQKGLAVDAFAAKTADMWRDGLAQWGQDGERIRRFADSVERTIYTPGSSAGVPLTILKSFGAPSAAVLADADAFRDRVQSAASGILALVGVQADPAQSREHILLTNVLDAAWRAGRDLDLGGIIREIQNPPFKQVGVVDLDSFFPAADRLQLGMKINNLLASPTFASWLEGEPLDIQRLLYTPQGKPRLSILSIAHLSDAERVFFVTILLNELLSWVRAQPGTGSLRALFYMDEVFGYFPPLGNPPTKRPMLTLLKQARAFGVGCVLATQNPVDLDYKGLSNAGTWFLGRLQTERDKLRVIEGLEGASAQAGAQFNRGQMEATLAGLGSRVFLMNDVHEATPTVFHTRWALSYLAGPLTREHVGRLMAAKKAELAAQAAATAPAAEAAQGASRGAARPVLSAEVAERFWPIDLAKPAPPGSTLVYRPAVLGLGRVHFVDDGVDVWRDVAALQAVRGDASGSLWRDYQRIEKLPEFAAAPAPDAAFAELPGELSQAKNYRAWQRELEERLYQRERLVRWRCAAVDETSRPDETEEAFRLRVDQLARERRDAAKEEVRRKFAARMKRQQEKIVKTRAKVEEQKSRFWWRVMEQVLRIVEVVGGTFLGRRSRKKLFTSTSAGQTMSARRAGSRAEEELVLAEEELAAMQAGMEDEIAALQATLEPSRLRLEPTEIAPRKADVSAEQTLLAWLPWREAPGASAVAAY